MENGLYQHLTRAEYDAISGRVNWSRLKAMSRSPRHFRHELTQPSRDTPARAFGRLVHVATLEPDRLASAYAVWGGERRAGRDWQLFQQENRDREIVTAADRDRALAIARAVRSDRTAAAYVTGGRAEVTVLWTHETPETPGGALPGFRFDCMARLDYVTDHAIVDLKSCSDASPDAFGRTCWNMQYHVQAAWYRDGFAAATGRTLPFVIVAVESEPPHVVQVYRVPDWILDEGRATYRALLARLDWCRRNAEWPGYSEGELDLVLPRWAVQPPDESDLSDTGIVFGGE